MFRFLKGREPAARPADRNREALWVCMGHPCRDLGSKRVLGVVRDALKRNGLDRRVRLREAACLALCGAGPNVKVMPDRVRYWETEPGAIDLILQQHYCDPDRDYSAEDAGPARVEEGQVVKAPKPGSATSAA